MCSRVGTRADIDRFLAELGPGTPIDGVPALVGARWRPSSNSSKNATDALESALARLQTFRQGPGVGRNRGQDRTPGRSRWPEAEAIRQITGRRLPKHAKLSDPVHKFPRAAFGMPIIFHFKDHRVGDPKDTHLQPEGKERRASPLILRPIRDGDEYRGLALVLTEHGRSSEPIELRHDNRRTSVKVALDPAEARLIKPLNGNPDPLDAFLQFFANP